MDSKISIIVCTYNRDKYIYDTLSKIARNNFPSEGYEIVLINNNSTDNTEEECKRFQKDYPKTNYQYHIETQQGLSFARNRGIKESHGDMLVFLDDDAFVKDNYLTLLSAYLKQYPDADAFGGKITPLFESGKTPEWIGKWSYSWVSALNKGNQVCLFTRKSYPIGANMGIRRSALPEGLFNTDLGRKKDNLMGGEEKDLFNRIKEKNAKIYYFPKIEVMHVIPEKRVQKDFIRQLALGVGKSERIRTQSISKISYFKSIFMEAIKWGATLLILMGYLLKATPKKGCILLFFRKYVTIGLLNR